MLPIERRGEILQKLMMDGKVVVNELAEKYEVTEETIRRDLEKLESDGYAKKNIRRRGQKRKYDQRVALHSS